MYGLRFLQWKSLEEASRAGPQQCWAIPSCDKQPSLCVQLQPCCTTCGTCILLLPGAGPWLSLTCTVDAPGTKFPLLLEEHAYKWEGILGIMKSESPSSGGV